MGQEKKIGVGIVVGLLVVLVIVLTLRLTTTKGKPLTALANELRPVPSAHEGRHAGPKGQTGPALQPVLLPAAGGMKTSESSRRPVISAQHVEAAVQLMPVPSSPPSMMPQLASAEQEIGSHSAPKAPPPAPRALQPAPSSTAGLALPGDPTPPAATMAVSPQPTSGRTLTASNPPSLPVPKENQATAEGSQNPLRGMPSARTEATELPAFPPRSEPTAGRTTGAVGGRYGDTTVGRSAEPEARRPIDAMANRQGDPDTSGSSAAPIPTYRQTTRYGYPPSDAPAPHPMNSSGYGSAGIGAGYASSAPPSRVSPDSGRRPDGTYKVQPNDSYWSISEKVFGTGAFFKALAEHNRDKCPRDDRLQAGLVISVPPVPELEKKYPDLCPKAEHRRPAGAGARSAGLSMVSQTSGRRVYVVVEGDTLSDIAKFELGKRSRWGEIYELNRDRLGDNYDYLVPGTELLLPDGESAPGNRGNMNQNTNLTTRPGSMYRR
jgi:nucleoid-associated protein YgaU